MDSPFGPKEYGLKNNYRNFEITPWDDDGKMIIKCVVAVKNVPFLTETRCTQTYQIKIKKDYQIVIELDSKTIDAPYSDTFSCKEVWIAMQSTHDKNYIIFSRYMNVVFVKRTLFKGKITTEAEKGIIENAKLWLTMAKQEGFFNLKAASQMDSLN